MADVVNLRNRGLLIRWSPAVTTALLPACLVAVAAASGVWRADPDVAARSAQYYMASETEGRTGRDAMLLHANAPARHGAMLIRHDGTDLESVSIDDQGYMLALQMASFAGVTVTGAGAAQGHAVIFVCAAVLFAWAVGARFRSLLVGVAILAAVLLLGSRLSMLIYGQVSNQTSTSLFSPLVLAALVAWLGTLDNGVRGRAPIVGAVGIGLLVGAVDLIRHSHGLAALLTLALIVMFGVHTRRFGVAGAILAGYLTMTILVPAGIKVHRDLHMNRWQGWRWSYLQRPPAHGIWYQLLEGVGRYPNALDLYYEDRSVDTYIEEHAGQIERAEGPDAAARPLFLDYALSHPVEYAGTLVSGAAELGPFLAYTTFMAPKRWDYAWPAVVPEIVVNPRDVARYGENLLQNFRLRYLRLHPWQWLVFGAAWAVIVGAVARVVVRGKSARSSGQPAFAELRRGRLLIGSALVYLAWVAAPRALIPVHGMDFVFAFWCVALLCAAHLAVGGAPAPQRPSYPAT